MRILISGAGIAGPTLELRRAGGDDRGAFTPYQRLLAPFLAWQQRSARHFAVGFAPRYPWQMFLRNGLFRLLSVPGVANLVASAGLGDAIDLPEFGSIRGVALTAHTS